MPGLRGYGPADLARLRSIQARPRGWTHVVKDQVREHKDERGHWVKVIKDCAGNDTIMRRDGQDVRIFLPAIRIQTRARVVR